MSFTVEHDFRKAIKALTPMKTDLEKKAVVRAMNRTIDQVKTEGSKQMRARYGFKASTVKDTMITYKANGTRLQATLRSRGRRTRLIDMSARQTAKGVSVKIGKTRKLIKGAFIATMKSGHIGVFIREPGTEVGKRGKPIIKRKFKELYTIAIPEALGSADIMSALKAKAADVFPKRLEHEINWLLKGNR